MPAKPTAPRIFLSCLIAAAFAFLIACPGPIINFDAFWNGTYPGSGVRYELFEHSRNGHGDLFTNTGLGWIYHLIVSLRYGMGTPLLLLSLAGIGYAVWKRRPEDLLLISFVLLYYGLAGFSAVRFARYMIPLFPAFSVLAARFIVAPFSRPVLGKVMAGLAAIVIFCAFGSSALLDMQLTERDSAIGLRPISKITRRRTQRSPLRKFPGSIRRRFPRCSALPLPRPAPKPQSK